MARIDNKGHLKGSVGPVTYHAYNGTTYIQTKPGRGRVKQTEGTKKSASDFGRASSLAKAIRTSLFPILQHHSDPAFYRRFTARVNAAAQEGNPNPKGSRSLMDGDLSLLAHTDCNIASPFALYCTLSPTLLLHGPGELTIALPGFNVLEHIVQYADATHATLAFLVTVVNPETNTQSHAEMFKLDLALTDNLIAAQEWTTTVLPEAQLIVVSAALFYYRNDRLAGMVGLNGKQFHPCEVYGVMRSGV